ncbi:hypothetical protein QBC44DRAFT_333313 [Cladorrhinum sp. PSN332]|nr:hypothetical protein QBC44DRAFT_333313 [Cladorrhinum sp. PSN332]
MSCGSEPSTTAAPRLTRRVGSDSSISAATILEKVRNTYPNPSKIIDGLLSETVARDQAELRPVWGGGYCVVVFPDPRASTNYQAALLQITGQAREGDSACLQCKTGRGIFCLCVSSTAWAMGACANCHYNGRGAVCSFRTHENLEVQGKRKRKPRRPKDMIETFGPEFEDSCNSDDPYKNFDTHPARPRHKQRPTRDSGSGYRKPTVTDVTSPLPSARRAVSPIVIDDSDHESPPNLKREPSPTGNTNAGARAFRYATPNIEPGPAGGNNNTSDPNFDAPPAACHGLPSPACNPPTTDAFFRPTLHAQAINAAALTHTSGPEPRASDNINPQNLHVGQPGSAAAAPPQPPPSEPVHESLQDKWSEIQELRFRVESNRQSAKMQTELADKLQADLDDKLLGRRTQAAEPSLQGNWEVIRELSFKIEAHRNYARAHTEEANNIINRLINGGA